MKKHTHKLALLGAAVALLTTPAVGLAATGVKVRVRVEGAKKELLDRSVTVSGGTLRRYGHSCPRQSGAGALDRATGGHWTGSYFSGLGFSVTSIFRESYPFTQKKFYWGIYVNGASSQVGMCSLKLRRGQEILFAAVPQSGIAYALRLTGPAKVAQGQSLRVKVLDFDAKGHTHPLRGARVSGGGQSAKSNAAGIVTLRPTHRGRLTLFATKPGFIRAPLVVDVSPAVLQG